MNNLKLISLTLALFTQSALADTLSCFAHGKEYKIDPSNRSFSYRMNDPVGGISPFQALKVTKFDLERCPFCYDINVLFFAGTSIGLVTSNMSGNAVTARITMTVPGESPQLVADKAECKFSQ